MTALTGTDSGLGWHEVVFLLSIIGLFTVRACALLAFLLSGIAAWRREPRLATASASSPAHHH
jgi:hypothetical protein